MNIIETTRTNNEQILGGEDITSNDLSCTLDNTLKDIDTINQEVFPETDAELEDLHASRDINEEASNIDKEDLKKLENAAVEYQNGNLEAFDYIYNFYRPKLERLSYRKNDEDLVQELSIVLLKAVETYDTAAGVKFNTYFWKCARNHIGTMNIRRSAKKRTAEFGVVSMQQTFSAKDAEAELGDFVEDKDAPVDYEESIFRMFLTDSIYGYLKDNEIKAIEMLLNGYTLEEIGSALGGITAPAVHIKFRRLKDKKIVGKHLYQLLENHATGY